jgi:hypothetical protein
LAPQCIIQAFQMFQNSGKIRATQRNGVRAKRASTEHCDRLESCHPHTA